MKTNKLQKGLARTCLTATAFSALLTLTTYIGAATAQSLDQNKPQARASRKPVCTSFDVVPTDLNHA